MPFRLDVAVWLQHLIAPLMLVYMVWGLRRFVAQSWRMCTLETMAASILVSLVMCTVGLLIAVSIHLLA